MWVDCAIGMRSASHALSQIRQLGRSLDGLVAAGLVDTLHDGRYALSGAVQQRRRRCDVRVFRVGGPLYKLLLGRCAIDQVAGRDDGE